MTICSGVLPRRVPAVFVTILAWGATLASPCLAQTTVSQDEVTLLNTASGSAAVPANTAAVDVSFPLEEALSGGGEIIVSTEIPEIGITVVLPNGVEITQTNASSLGAVHHRSDMRDPNAAAALPRAHG